MDKVPTCWSAAERELAIANRATKNIREISQILYDNGYERNPKAVEKFFERIGLTQEQARRTLCPQAPEVQPDDKGPLQTTWGEPMLVINKQIEFGIDTPIVPVVFLPDIHAPFQDDKAIELACKIIEQVRPVAIVYTGDNVDWAQISSFDKAPERITKAQEEVDTFHAIDRMVASAAGKDIRRYYILGNHEYRLRAYQCKNPAASAFRGLQFDSILGLGPQFKPIPNLQLIDGEILWRDCFVAKHGDAVRKFPGWSARAELESLRLNGISGHTHRANVYYTTQRKQMSQWVENGCLCNLDPEYMRNPNWQHAITVGYFNGDNSNNNFYLDQIIFTKYSAIVNGNLVTVK